MSSSAPEQHRAFAEVRELVKKLNEAYAAENWDETEQLLQQRNAAVNRALTEDLPVSLYVDANQLLQELRQQDATLKTAAEAVKNTTAEELVKLRKQKKSIDAYRD